MDNKVSKNTFLHKFVKLHLDKSYLAIVKLLQQQLVKTVDLYQQSKNWGLKKENLTKLIANTTSFCNSSQQQAIKAGVVYRCAIALPLGHQFKLPPWEIAEELAQLLATANDHSPTIPYLEFIVRVFSTGWLDLELSDRSFAIWLQGLVQEIQREGETGRRGDAETRGHREREKEKKVKYRENMFPLQYVHARCCSLLRLGHQEGLIELREKPFCKLNWQLVQPNPIPWLDSEGNFHLTHPTERRLLVWLFIVVEEFALLRQDNSQKLAHNLSEAMLAFTAECRIWGEIKQQKPQLAQARLGIIALVQWCLYKLLQEKLSILAITEL
jgi:hypothetical protein